MRIALLIDRDNFEAYSNWEDSGWDIIHMGKDDPDRERLVATGANVLVVDAMMKIASDTIENMPRLQLIHSQGVGYNAIDIESARKAGIYVCNNAGVNAQAVAEYAVLLILALLKRFRWGEDMVYAGRQMEAKTACFKNPIPELGSVKVGIVGFGAIGSTIAALLRPFGCKIRYYTRSGDCGVEGCTYMPLEELYADSDIISLNVPVTGETANMVNRQTLKQFKRGAVLINTSRGELMDHGAVVEALISGRLGGLGADTLAPEPFLLDNPVLRDLPPEFRDRVALSPHVAGISEDCFIRVYSHIKSNIEALARSERPDCIVNGL